MGALVQPLGFEYEQNKMEYIQFREYKPDFSKNGFFHIETKGKFDAQDRRKMKDVLDQHAHQYILMVFGRADNKITKRSKTTYGDWCTKNNISWVDITTFRKDYKKLCRLLMMKKKVYGKL